MKIVENITVRRLHLELTKEEFDKLHQKELELIQRGVFTKTQSAGPMANAEGHKFFRVSVIDDSYADELLEALK